MRKIDFTKRINQSIINSIMIGIIMLIIVGMVSINTADRKRQKNSLDITHGYLSFENSVQNFIINNSTLIDGFSAYVESFDIEYDEDVYTYLGNLLDDRMYYIKSVGIIKDTTVLWNFPLEGNRAAIGTDLARISAQRASILEAKLTLESSFDGPIDLVQGGSGYIIRNIITKNDKYWGLASIVLYDDKVKELFDSYAEENHIKVAIFNKEGTQNLIYGDKNIKNQNPLVFHNNVVYNDWTFYVLPDEDTNNNTSLILIGLSGLILTTLITYKSYMFFKAHYEIRRKNIILKKTSVKDKLTELYNRSYLDAMLVEEAQIAKKNKSLLSCIYFDLDYFKEINDTYGHALGDRVLKDIAVLVKTQIRNSDIFARWGGDEFFIIMPNTSLDGAFKVAEKIKSTIEEYDNKIVGKKTASFGVAEYSIDETPNELFDRADKALYFAKENGRNTVCTIDMEGTLTCY